MREWGFIRSSLRFYARSHAWVLAGVAVAVAILTGALAMGDCARGSLRDLALARIGRTTFALASGDRFFRSALADEFPGAAAVLQLRGTAAAPDDSARANHVQILGVDRRFWELAPTPVVRDIPPGCVAVNAALARQLRVKAGDTIILRVEKPSLLSQEAAISPREDVSTGLRVTVLEVVTDAGFGRFGLRAGQASPLNAFLPLGWLQGHVDQAGLANVILTGGAKPDLRRHWTLADAGLEWRETPGGLELRSGRVFIDPETVAAAGSWCELVLTYFVNEMRDGERAAPYSMAAAAGPPLVPAGMGDDEIIVNEWLAEDLRAGVGDELQLTYLVPGAAGRLEERRDGFRVRGVAAMELPWADRTLMPDFPGIARAERTEEWDAGFAIDMRKVRPKDEEYWRRYRGTPKAFVTLAAGRRMWGSRFGDVTAIRFARGVSRVEAERGMLSRLDPAALGLAFTPAREEALAACSQSEDFGGLFLGFSFFLVAAALILLGLLFQFGMEQRAEEAGVLLAMGWRARRVRRLFLMEGAVVAVAGGALGVAGGMLYAKAMLLGLATLWGAAGVESPLQFHVTAWTLAAGGVSGIFISWVVIWLTVRGQAGRPARELLEQGNELEREAGGAKDGRRWGGWIAAVGGLGAAALVAAALARGDSADAGSFFGAGSLLLISGLALTFVWLRGLAAGAASGPLTLAGLSARGCGRRRRRSLAIVALLGAGSFLIAAVQANKLDATRDSGRRSSGTGGFALVGESSVPVVQDLNSRAGREFFGLDEGCMKDVAVVSLRAHDGEDASCLNLSRARAPRLLGVDPRELEERKAFVFTQAAGGAGSWMMLEGGGVEIPAVGDEATITWALHKKIGDTVEYADEHGRLFRVRLVGALANSVLQGNLIVAEPAFVRHFPGEAGYRMFLVDAPAGRAGEVSVALTRGLRERGLELTPAVERLNAFNAAQNSYLDTFQVLGGLGLLLGSAGMGVVVMRNVLERRGELALLAAAGFNPRVLTGLVAVEHAVLQALGLALGAVSAVLALLPVLLSPTVRVGVWALAGMLGLVFLSGLFWTWAAARLALRGELLTALRNE